MKRILITSTDLMMIQFLIPHVKHLSENGFEVELACSVVGDRIDEVRAAVAGVAKAVHTVRLERSPASGKNLAGYRDMKRLLKENRYDIIWTNEPVMGVVTRLAANKYRKSGTKVVYMCHGFHFYKGASPLNWLLFYPVERLLAHACDAIVTMNQEDYSRAKHFKTGSVHKISGVGVDTRRFNLEMNPAIRTQKRQELGLPVDAYVILTVGELTKRKNQKVVLRALADVNDPSIHYVLCGRGDLQPFLENLAKELGLMDRIHFLGYRMDIPQICRMADCFVFPSLQEGLPFALMEAMESGLPIVCSRIRGNVDLIDDPQGGILCGVRSSEDFCRAIQAIRQVDTTAMAQHNHQKLAMFRLNHTKHEIIEVLTEV